MSREGLHALCSLYPCDLSVSFRSTHRSGVSNRSSCLCRLLAPRKISPRSCRRSMASLPCAAVREGIELAIQEHCFLLPCTLHFIACCCISRRFCKRKRQSQLSLCLLLKEIAYQWGICSHNALIRLSPGHAAFIAV